MSTATDQTRPADLLGMALAHRMMRTDLHRLTDAAQQIADGAAACPDRRARALARWVGLVCDEIHHHHTAEDDIAWPVIARHAGDAVDLTELSDDHAALDPLLAGVRTAATALREAAAPDRPGAAQRLTERLARLRDEIDEHLEVEERDLFPIIERYVPQTAWKQVEEGVRTGGPGLRFMLPRLVDVLVPGEWETIRAEAGPALVALAALLRPGHRRRVRLVFGRS